MGVQLQISIIRTAFQAKYADIYRIDRMDPTIMVHFHQDLWSNGEGWV